MYWNILYDAQTSQNIDILNNRQQSHHFDRNVELSHEGMLMHFVMV